MLLIVSRDRTEYLETEELLQKSEKLAAVGQLATAIAHEIRNPLTAIKGFMQLLTEKASKEELTYMNIISSEIERIEMITDEFMSVAKPQAVTFQSIDLQLLIQQVILLLQPQATMKNIFIELHSYGELPLVYCESNQMKQVFINILKNAIEAMPSGGEIKVELRQKDNNHLHIQIIDEGVGISKDRIKHLGEPFYSIKEDGIGLGLMICFNIIQQHKGTLSIESEVNKGTNVEICLPLK